MFYADPERLKDKTNAMLWTIAVRTAAVSFIQFSLLLFAQFVGTLRGQ